MQELAWRDPLVDRPIRLGGFVPERNPTNARSEGSQQPHIRSQLAIEGGRSRGGRARAVAPSRETRPESLASNRAIAASLEQSFSPA
jgi:hypothetical protein